MLNKMPVATGIAMQLRQALAGSAHGSHAPVGHQPHSAQGPQSNSMVSRSQGPLMVNSNTNTVDTGRYTINANNDHGGTLNVKDNVTGESFKVWGDPHIETSDGDKTDFMQKPATFMLPDGTKITVTPTQGEDKTYIDNVTITRGNDAAQIGGVHSGNMHTEALRGEGQYLDQATPDGTVLHAKDGHIQDLMLNNGTEIKGNNIKNIDQFATAEQKPASTRHHGPFPEVMHPGMHANRPNHMGPFSSNMPKDWGIAMLFQMGMYLAAMLQGTGTGSGSSPSTGTGSTPSTGSGSTPPSSGSSSAPPSSGSASPPLTTKPAPAPAPSTKPAVEQGPMMVNSNTNTVDTGRYTIHASKDDGGTLTVTDNTSGENFKIWGDPHIETGDGDKTDFMHQPATFMLDDGTKITVTPTQGQGATYIDNVTITRGNDAAQIGGVHDGNLNTTPLRGEGRYLDDATPDGTVLRTKDGHVDDLVLADGTEIKGNNVANIDGYGANTTAPAANTTAPAANTTAPADNTTAPADNAPAANAQPAQPVFGPSGG
jgi:hypothetical protein